MYTKEQIEFLNVKQYLKNETIDERIKAIGNVVRKYKEYGDPDLADRIESYIKAQILCPSTPQLANLGRDSKELPCSCNIITVPNSISGIYNALGEVAMLSKLGAGVVANYVKLPNKGTFLKEGFYSNSKLDWAEDSIRTANKVSQGATRRGYAVPFFSIDDGEFYDILNRGSKTNPDKNDPFVKNNIGFILPEGFRQRLRGGDVEAKKRFVKVLQERKSTGKYYLLDVENCNNNKSPVYEKLNHSVESTNICTEVLTPNYDDKTFSCIILSLNLNKWDYIKENPQIIRDAFIFADIVVSEYIKLSEGVAFLEKARKSVIEKRDIGVGTLGFHDYIQSKGCAFGDLKSRQLNRQIYSTIRDIGEQVTKELGSKLGSPKMCKEAGLVRRNVSLMAIAPNKSTSFIYGPTSGGIEPFISNYFMKSLAGIQTIFKNKNLEKLLIEKGKNTEEVWQDILENLGSVQHLDFLTEIEKQIFRTANEISPKDIIDLAADRQFFIDMGQSLNLFNRPNYTMQDLIEIHMYAFDKGIKTLYYFYPQVHVAIEKTGESWDNCISCAD